MPQGDLNTTSYLILGLLASKDWSAYELAEQVGRGVAELWPLADRQRYNAPKRLRERGLVTARTERNGRRERTVYSINDAGRRALREWLTADAHPPALEFEGMVRVIMAEQGTIDDLRANLQLMGAQARERRSMFSAHAAHILATDGGTFPEREHLMALANRFMIGHFTHIADWADWALTETASWDDTATPATSRHERSAEILEAILDEVPNGP